ncbi:MAG: cysteine--tRNA ligase [Elusimicrobiota bacterium]
MKEFFIYNTLSKQKEEFIPMSPGRVSMYVCGITPYSDAHLGHARCYIVFDTLKRFLQARGLEVFYVQNITDIDDKIINKSRETGELPADIAKKYFAGFCENMKKLNVMPADAYPRVSEHINTIVDFVKDLIDNDMAYEINGSVYFRVARFSGYGSLSGRDPSELVSKEDIIAAKEDTRDFALWKTDEEYGWKSPWGMGRPGWHIECSAMSRQCLGDQFDIHGGGLDLIFPHHENEVAQSEALTGKNPVKYWVHNGMVTLKGDKMAKSTGNFFLLQDLLSQYEPMVLRMYLLSCGYRQVLDFSTQGLEDTGKAYEKVIEFKKEIIKTAGSDLSCDNLMKDGDEISDALNDDMNTAQAIGEIFKKMTPIKERLFKGESTDKDIIEGVRLINVFEDILGIRLEIRTAADEKE